MYVHMNISMYGVICESKYIMYAKGKITNAEEAAVENRGFRDRDCVWASGIQIHGTNHISPFTL